MSKKSMSNGISEAWFPMDLCFMQVFPLAGMVFVLDGSYDAW